MVAFLSNDFITLPRLLQIPGDFTLFSKGNTQLV